MLLFNVFNYLDAPLLEPFQDISCYCSTNSWMGASPMLSNFKTFHVTVQHQLLPMFYVEIHLISRHFMLLFNVFRLALATQMF